MKRLVVALLVIGGCAPGEPVGQIDPMKGSTLDVDAVAAGDKLRFRVACEVDTNGQENALEDLQRSQLAVTVKDPKGETVVRCPLTGTGDMRTKSGSKLRETGLLVGCEVPIGQAGKHQVSAKITWDPAIKPLSANVEVRREKRDTK